MMGLSPSRPPPSVQINVNYHNTRTHSQISTAISLCSVQCFVHYPQLRDTVCGNKCCCLMFLNGNFEHHRVKSTHIFTCFIIWVNWPFMIIGQDLFQHWIICTLRYWMLKNVIITRPPPWKISGVKNQEIFLLQTAGSLHWYSKIYICTDRKY